MSKNPKVFNIGDVVEHKERGRCIVDGYYRGQYMPYDLRPEDVEYGGRFPSFKKDMKLAGPRPPEPYEEWFR